MTLLALLLTAALVTLCAIAVTNAREFPRLGAQPPDSPGQPPAPKLSVLIPARNEGRQIRETVARLLQQGHACYEVLVMDDDSSDDTAAEASAAGAGDACFRLLRSSPLPPGWTGKNWACHQLAQAAAGEVLVFTDADVQWQPAALAALIAEMERSDADLLTVWPSQVTVTWGERLVVPLMALAVLAYLPVRLAHATPYPLAAAANGQCMAFRRRAYAECGGHAGVCGQIVEDIQLARRVKAAGLHLRMADGAGLIRCRMYDGWRAVFHGYAKNILAGHGNSPALLLASTAFHLSLFVLPWLWLALGPWLGYGPGWPLWPLTLASLGVAVRAITAASTGQRVGDALFLPISVLLMTGIAGYALLAHMRHGGARWKGRFVPTPTASDAPDLSERKRPAP